MIRKRTFTSARPHDSTQKKYLLSGDEEAKFGDNAYSKQEDKREARKNGVYYGILDKATRKRKLSNKQKKTNKKKTLVRNQVLFNDHYVLLLTVFQRLLLIKKGFAVTEYLEK